ncbi:DNA-directed RNA polymerase subunit beta' [Lactococcus cremoris subsp. cremoris SK11]|uniref:DNA-directed RNA polymerase subunit beta' n=2 Tax=Lactococcus lactis subsp. cremoris TaxID=1359 RepID=RPOC_LACLS|nr:DNA-directed RNA polymerase subunit beta' [Lactococcus cremoris]Q02X60.1 RecName: Full=DNA-directed RNA polymerase subunit beta'; Short=RNAP subunit beta'; AltName: Full=RNA polymerase subunit beta'; AltName: Full=Transcriptase subunit beta' [Lactococcus cremoris subsp. cremoris SK11]ABJ73462.1 DNA-directed RNA polymerase subunit beta' [Lactococcus cremoris subsp. cremoris SK11]ARE24074.1 DNA-directed RNA polymerase subunit beta' [Lactococcus cremoris]KZK47371.1 DNA-directed RNA polymerase b
MVDVNKFESMRIGIASPQKIRYWSFGEVKKPETINYRTQKPEREGLFDERIFGPQKDWECACGKLKGVFYKNQVCELCGVQVTTAKSRRERMGHIELAAPISHIWYFKGIPSRMGLALDMSPRALEEVIYFASYVVIDPKETDLEKKQLLTEREYREQLLKNGFGSFVAKMGAEAIQDLLNDVDIDKEVAELKEELKTVTGQRRVKIIRRLDVLSAFRKSGNALSWMVLNVLPVIPPDLRPMVQLDGGRFATSDLNDLYRRVINRNNRLKRLMELNAPNIIVQNEKRMLQEAVDTLIDNGRRGRPITGAGNRPLKSLSHMLKGKQGRFRQNLLGKRVDYSGRSVIAVGPTLKMYQCGVPREMAIELFKPFVMAQLVKKELAANIRAAKRKVERQDSDVWDVLETVVKEHPVLLNRAPTLHRLGIQAFEPVLIDGKAIRLHPLACEAYNADFDGDQMAIHLPLSEEAQAEARLLMLAAEHILNPKDGKPVVTPSQDMVLGNYYLTMEEKGREGEGMIFATPEEVEIAMRNGYVHLHTRIGIATKSLNKPWTENQQDKILVTTVGKVIFNSIIPEGMPYLNEPTDVNLTTSTDDRFFMDAGQNIKEVLAGIDTVRPFKKGYLGNIIAEVFKRYRTTATSEYLDRLKDLGYYQSTLAGLTVGIADIPVVEDKHEIIDAAHKRVEQITKQFRRGLITDDERYNAVTGVWRDAKESLEKRLIEEQDLTNPIVMMMDSGARGNISNFSQLAGMRGLMAAPNGKIMELPIISNFREGLSVLEMFFSTHGARKGMTDTALKTADSGYLTRRLVDVAQDVIIREDDCGTDRGLVIADIATGKEMVEPLFERLVGRYTRKSVLHPETGEMIIGDDTLISEDIARKIIEAGVKEVTIRSVFTCKTPHGVCKHCYGINLATGDAVEVGEAVGTIAAQSIGEPGTQLTMRTFHTGGVASSSDITQGLPRVQEIFEARNPKGEAIITEVTGTVESIVEDGATRTREITVKGKTDTRSYTVGMADVLMVEEGEFIHRGAPLIQGSIEPKHLLQVRDALSVETYLLGEVQKTYRSQGVEIGDKHIEVMVRQMLRKVRIMDNGSIDVLPGTLMDISDFEALNETALLNGEMPATGRPVLMGITKASLETNSFLSAASFQETTRVLTDAAIRGKEDHLLGLKENVIIGKIIPAGTGMFRYRNIEPLADLTNAPEVKEVETETVEN